MEYVTMYKFYCGGTFGFDFLENGYRQKAATDYRAVLLGDAPIPSPSAIPLPDKVEHW